MTHESPHLHPDHFLRVCLDLGPGLGCVWNPRRHVAVMLAMQAAPGPLDDLRRFLPLALKLARMPDSDEPRFRRRMREEPTMGNMLDDIKADGRAEGKIAEIRRLVAKGRLTVDAARSEIREMIEANEIPAQIGQEALGQLS